MVDPWIVPERSAASASLTVSVTRSVRLDLFVNRHAGRSEHRPPLGSSWCRTVSRWQELEQAERPHTYTVVFALRFLDAVPDRARASAAIDRFGPLLDQDGGMPVPGGIEGEHVTALDLSPHPGSLSRRPFTAAQIDAQLDRLASEQLDDGGWDFDFLHWSPGQALDWRGSVTVSNLRLLHDHGRLPALVTA